MSNPIRIEVTEEQVKAKSDSEKLDLLVGIAFANRIDLLKQHKLLFGNGNPKEGLCFRVAVTATRLNWLIGILSVVAIAALGVIGSIISGRL